MKTKCNCTERVKYEVSPSFQRGFLPTTKLKHSSLTKDFQELSLKKDNYSGALESENK